MDCSLNSSSFKIMKTRKSAKEAMRLKKKKKKTSFSTCTNQANKILKLSPSPEHTFCDNEFTDVQTYQRRGAEIKITRTLCHTGELQREESHVPG